MLNSSIKKTFSLITSQRLSAKENMHMDKELFESFKASDMPIFRVYAWEESFTYGVSQKINSIKNLNHLSKYKQNYAQRITGGGILFHGNDISYSLIIPTSYVKNLSVKQSYELVCNFLMEFYRSLGLNPVYAKDLEEIHLSKSDYCQEGFEPYDILVNGKKIGGNAQRRSKDTIFQHGSIGIDNSMYSMGNSLEDLGVKISFEEARILLLKSFENTFSVVFEQNNKDILYAS
ncbi:MAG: ligase [Sulfurovum sp.]|nr:MAG: ligase [Sulfurovum sp.]